MAVILQYVMGTYTFMFLASLAGFGFGGFLFLITAIRDIKSNLKSMNVNAKIKTNRSNIFKQLFDFIQTHSTLKQLSKIDRRAVRMRICMSIFLMLIQFFSDWLKIFRPFFNRCSWFYLWQALC